METESASTLYPKENIEFVMKYSEQHDDSNNDSQNNIDVLQMENSDVEQEQFTDSEIISEPFNPQSINITPRQITIYSLCQRLTHKEINLFTDFQRKGDLWKKQAQSRLIESILIRFPLPTFYFDGSDDGHWLVVDGLQRLSTLKNFILEKTLRLTGLEYLVQFEGYSYDELPRELQRRIYETDVLAYIINPGTPPEVKFNLFKRINTTALLLTSQEIRNALNQGTAADFVAHLAASPEFQRATAKSVKPDRMEDRDLVMRFLAFQMQDYSTYQPSLDSFLSRAMAHLAIISAAERDELAQHFYRAMNAAFEIFGENAFRKINSENPAKRNPINKALFEALSVALAAESDANIAYFVENRMLVRKFYEDIFSTNLQFHQSITRSTGDKRWVEVRHTIIRHTFAYIIQHPEMTVSDYYDYISTPQ
jgi:hypothetical protein